MIKWSRLEEHYLEWKSHRELLHIEKDSRSQQILKSERKNKSLFLHVITHLLYNVVCDGFKNSMVSSLEKLYSRLDPNDATLYK